MARASVLLALPLLVLGCGSAAEPVRVLELGESIQVDWPRELRHTRPPKSLRTQSIGAVAEPGRVVELVMYDDERNFDTRAALLAPPGATYRVPVRPPAGSELRLGLGYVVYKDRPAQRIGYRVRVLSAAGGDSETLLAEEVMTSPKGGWRDHRLSLARWAGQDVVLELAVERGPPAEQVVWAAFSAPEILPGRQRQDGPHVILVSLDTLRADHLGCYGYRRPTSPHLDALAARGFRFAQAVSQSPWTRPSHKSLFTGQYPLSRGGAEAERFATVLWRAGYRTGALTGGGQVASRFGFATGFESYRESNWTRRPEEIAAWFDEAPGRKSFLFLHTFEIHDPYDHAGFAEHMPAGRLRPGFDTKKWWALRQQGLSEDERAYVEALYDGGIRFTDAVLGRVFAELEERGILERAIVVVTSDHGEQFFEHGSWRHGSNVYDHQLLVPLILHLPPDLERAVGGGGQVIEQQVELMDVYPTLLDLLGLEPPQGLQGQSLRPLLAGEGRPPDALAFAEHTNISRESKALRSRRLKLIYSYPRHKGPGDHAKLKLFDLARDPREQHNLAAERAELAARLRSKVETLIGIGGSPPEFEEEVPKGLDPELRQELEALGYVGGG